MRIARVARGGAIGFGVIEGEQVAFLDGPPIGEIRFTGDRAPLADCRLLAPVLPSKIVAVSGNYPANAVGARDEPLLFLKPSTAVVGPGEPIRRPQDCESLEQEGELAIVVAGLVRNADEDAAERAILGYTCANDVTWRDLQGRGEWARAKGYDSFCPLGPWIETTTDPGGLTVTVRVNGEERQSGSTKDMRFPATHLVAFVSRVMTLLPGDVILTGTPAGTGPIEPGDAVEVEIESIGALSNPVVAG